MEPKGLTTMKLRRVLPGRDIAGVALLFPTKLNGGKFFLPQIVPSLKAVTHILTYILILGPQKFLPSTSFFDAFFTVEPDGLTTMKLRRVLPCLNIFRVAYLFPTKLDGNKLSYV
jgi:hypothetical protein